MSRSRPWSDANPDLRRQTQLPTVPIEQIEQRLYELLSPGSFKPLRQVLGKEQQRLRERILTLPVMMAVVLSLVYRRIPSLSELLRVLRLEGLLWGEHNNVVSYFVAHHQLLDLVKATRKRHRDTIHQSEFIWTQPCLS